MEVRREGEDTGSVRLSGHADLACFVFFFQAEDGIRDLTVTGVQTCALPICLFDGRADLRGRVVEELDVAPLLDATIGSLSKGQRKRALLAIGLLMPHPLLRSEERRVGKECRSRWSPYH